jgi:hypothetical protein
MTGVAWPINASAGAPSYSARNFRNAFASLEMWDGVPLGGRQGVRAMGGTAANIVTLSGSTITIGLHAALVSPTWATVTGSYQVALTVAETKTLTPADATNPRKDIVIGRVYDNDEFASGFRKYEADYIAGTAGPSPSEPAVPTGAIRLATIDVPASGGGSPVVTTNYQFTAAAGGVLPVRTTAERDAIVNPHEGQMVWRLDKGWIDYRHSGAWRSLAQEVDTTNDVSNPLTGQTVWHRVNLAFWTYSGSAWVCQKLASQQQATGLVNTSSTTYVALSGDPGLAFTAPVSGQIWVNISSALSAATDDGVTARASWQIRTGTTIGSGTIVAAASDNDSIAQTGIRSGEYGRERIATGLTGGTTYNVQMLYKGDGSVNFQRRSIGIKDAR